jgi:Cys-tRNA(Pro) deacylase
MTDAPITAATRTLDAGGVDYSIEHVGRVNSAHEAAEARGIPISALAKSLVVRLSKDEYVVVLVPADRELDYPKLRELLGVRRLTMPSPDEALHATGYERGTITPLGAGGWPTIIDHRLIAHDAISLGSGSRGWAIRLAPSDLATVTSATVADVSATTVGSGGDSTG